MNPSERPTELTRGTILQNHYRIIENISEGGMGRVYKAVDTGSGVTRALKQTFYSGEEERSWFLNEARLLERLDDECLPKVYDFFCEGNNCFLVMDLIPGLTLDELLKITGALSPTMIFLWTKKLLGTLKKMHTQAVPIIHRDIKPQNIKVHGRNKVYLLDFGLAKAGVHTVVPGYTRHYSPLEQERGLGTDERSDLYSLGATLYRALTGKVPHDAYCRFRKIKDGKPDPVRPADEIDRAIGGMAAIIHKAMALEPNDRFASAEDMLKALVKEDLDTWLIMRGTQISFYDGMEAARYDLQRGYFAIMVGDKEPDWFIPYAEKLKEEYGIHCIDTAIDTPTRLSFLQGMSLKDLGSPMNFIFMWMVAYINGYNKVSMAAIKERFGEDINSKISRSRVAEL